MQVRRARWLVATVAVALIVGACGADREETAQESTAPSAGETTTAAPRADMFGNLPSPCGEGDASGATAKGVTGDRLDTVLAAVTGGLLRGWADRPEHVVSPAIDDLMRWSGLAAADWLAQRRGW